MLEFGFNPFNKRKVELLDMLNTFLIEQYSKGKKVLLIVDEAQNLTKKVLEEIRLLSGVETHKENVLRIIWPGSPNSRTRWTARVSGNWCSASTFDFTLMNSAGGKCMSTSSTGCRLPA